MSRIRSTTVVRGTAAAFVAIAMLSAAVLVSSAPASAAAPYCGITWGSLAKADSRMSLAQITNLRAGQHSCFDRFVVDLRSGPAPGYSVQYGGRVFGDGRPVSLRGGAFLHVAVRAPAHDENYIPTYDPPNPAEAINVSGFRTFRQVAFGATFEAVTDIGIGVRARLPFRVFTLAGPGAGTRLVIDVAHRWS